MILTTTEIYCFLSLLSLLSTLVGSLSGLNPLFDLPMTTFKIKHGPVSPSDYSGNWYMIEIPCHILYLICDCSPFMPNMEVTHCTTRQSSTTVPTTASPLHLCALPFYCRFERFRYIKWSQAILVFICIGFRPILALGYEQSYSHCRECTGTSS